MEVILLIGLVGLISLNMYASYQSYRDAFSSRGQHIAQIIFIWLVPVIGAVLAIRMLHNASEQGNGTYPPETNLGTEYVTGCGRQNSEGYISSPDDNFHSTGSGNSSPD